MKLSVVIPAWNEAETLSATLDAIPEGAEVVVVDGGSVDGTPDIAHRAGVRESYTITEIDGVAVENSFHMQMLVGVKMAGDPVHLKMRKRDSDEVVGVTVFLTRVPDAEMEAAEPEDPHDRPWEDRDKDR